MAWGKDLSVYVASILLTLLDILHLTTSEPKRDFGNNTLLFFETSYSQLHSALEKSLSKTKLPYSSKNTAI